MNVDVNYDDLVEKKNTHPMLLPQEVEVISDEAVELLAKSGVTQTKRVRPAPPASEVLANKRVSWKVPLVRRRSVLSDGKIAKLKLGI